MDSSRRAVESYWRSRMVDAATSDEDKVTPVYKLEEICELLRSSHVSIVKEVSEFVLKRLEHKSPVVKQKALRLIKYAVGKSGVEFRREMQRHSAAVRQLFHYKGQLDPLKGGALNKAVRDTARETISAIFSEENQSKPAPTEDLNKRIQGFGNTNFEMPSEDKKSFLSEVVGIGSASIKQGLSSFTQGHSSRKNDNGSYKSPNLRRSLTIESDYSDKYEPAQLPNEAQNSLGKNVAGGPWGQDSKLTNPESNNEHSSSTYKGSKTREEKLLETIVTSGGVRLQPTRDALQVFLVTAAKLEALALCHALESKLQSPVWQVRMKAICVLEAILRRKDDEHFSTVASYFSDNADVILRCSESPQTSLREKSNKVLSLLDAKPVDSSEGKLAKAVMAETASAPMPDLIDTTDPDGFLGADSTQLSIDKKNVNQPTVVPLIDDLFGDGLNAAESAGEENNDDDPFADVSFHASEGREQVDDLFTGMTFDDRPRANENPAAANKSGPELFDIFGSHSEVSLEQAHQKENVIDLMAGLSIDESVQNKKQQGTSPGVLPESMFSDLSDNSANHFANNSFSNLLGSQVAGMNANQVFPSGTLPYNMQPGMMLNPAFHAQPIHYAGMGSFLAQQQFLATMSNFQHLSGLDTQNAGVNHAAGANGGGYAAPLPDIFQPNFANQAPTSLMNNTKKEDTRAFDFISDHVATARDPKRVI